MKRAIAIVLVSLVLSTCTLTFANTKAADQTPQIAPELASVIENINLSLQVQQREDTSLRTYIQYLIQMVIEKDKEIAELEAKVK